jgi:hypothetical protein
MPYAIRKVKNKSCYKVYNKKTKRVSAKCTSKTRAKKQIKLLSAIEYNKDFVPMSQMSKSKGRKTMKRRK